MTAIEQTDEFNVLHDYEKELKAQKEAEAAPKTDNP